MSDELLKKFPADSLLSQMVINIYANKDNGDITVLHDRPFAQKIKRLQYNHEKRELIFFYEDDSSSPYGQNITDNIGKHLKKAKEATFFEINTATKKPQNGFFAPVKNIIF